MYHLSTEWYPTFWRNIIWLGALYRKKKVDIRSEVVSFSHNIFTFLVQNQTLSAYWTRIVYLKISARPEKSFQLLFGKLVLYSIICHIHHSRICCRMGYGTFQANSALLVRYAVRLGTVKRRENSIVYRAGTRHSSISLTH